jgi:hypothetical protein
MNNQRKRKATIAAVVDVMAGVSSSLRAGSTYLVATGGASSSSPTDLSLAASYVTGGPPLTTDVAQISTNNVGTTTNYYTFDTGFSIGQLDVDIAPTTNGTTGSEIINSANTLTLNGISSTATTGGILLNASTGATLTINAPIQLTTGEYFTSNRNLTISGNITAGTNHLYTEWALAQWSRTPGTSPKAAHLTSIQPQAITTGPWF